MAISLRFATSSFRPAISRNGEEDGREEARAEVILGVLYRDRSAGRQLVAGDLSKIFALETPKSEEQCLNFPPGLGTLPRANQT